MTTDIKAKGMKWMDRAIIAENRVAELEGQLSAQIAETPQNCREAGPGKGLCDHCAAGHYERCRYVAAVQTEQPSLSDARIYEFANAICTPTNGGWHFADGSALMLFTRALLAQHQDRNTATRMFPMQHPNLPIPWELAEIIYAGYSARYGTSLSLEQLAEHGGFGWGEVAAIYKHSRSRSAIDRAIANGAPKE